jgi:hypothetical protein
MVRASIGLVLGGLGGLGMVYLIGFFHTAAYGPSSWTDVRELMLGAFFSGVWALAGAVVGATGDVLAFLRRVHPRAPRAALEADYQELGRPARPAA